LKFAKAIACATIATTLLLNGCDTMNALSEMKMSDLVTMPWGSTIEDTAPVRASEDVPKREAMPIPEGLQHDDLRAPFGSDDTTSVAARSGL
jgi:hypothetical protein